MTAEIILQIVLFGVALAMDAFAVSVTDGLTYEDIDRKKSVFIAATFGVMQALMPLFGFFAIELVTFLVGETAGARAGEILGIVITWVSFALLTFIGGKMLIEGIRDVKHPETREKKKFSVKEVLIMGVATAIDAMAVGITLHAGLSTTTTVWLHVTIIMSITFVISLLGVFLGNFFVKLFKGKYELTVVFGGAILLLLAVWVVLSHYLAL